MIPCSNPTICGVRNHHPGTVCGTRDRVVHTGVDVNEFVLPAIINPDSTQVGRLINRRGRTSRLARLNPGQQDIIDRLDSEVISNTDFTHYAATHYGGSGLWFRSYVVQEDGSINFDNKDDQPQDSVGWIGQARNPGGRGMGRRRYRYRVSMDEQSLLRVQTFCPQRTPEDDPQPQRMMDRSGLTEEEASEALAEFEEDASTR